jgi:hypothetical protein
MWLGVGFRERETAFDFKTALNEFIKYIDRLEFAHILVSIDHLDGNEMTAGGGEDDGESNAHEHQMKLNEVSK